jgi:hypothetical protein
MTEEEKMLLELAQDNEAYSLMSKRDRQRVRKLENELLKENENELSNHIKEQ